MKQNRIEQSKRDREALIVTLTQVLEAADVSISEDRIRRLRDRIEKLQRRNESPEEFLHQGTTLRQRYASGIPEGAGTFVS